MMRLKKEQKERVLGWIAEGLGTNEINTRAENEAVPFEVSPQQVDFYRRTRQVNIAALIAADETEALTAGLANKAERVTKLRDLAALLEKDLFGDRLWTDQVKSIGSGGMQQIVNYEEFNASEVTQYRGILDDIAKEVGGRRQEVDVTGIHTIRIIRTDD